MDDIEHTLNYSAPPVDRREIARYARGGELTPAQNALLDECLAEMLPALEYKVCWRYFPIQANSNELNLGFTHTKSLSLLHNLQSCSHILLFAATIGLAPDRLIAKYGRLSPVKALFCQAIGAERIEALCDTFCQERTAEIKTLQSRFSPGYGDLPLTMQKDIFNVLDCPRKIGLTLTDSLLMVPTKSVTALAGFTLVTN